MLTRLIAPLGVWATQRRTRRRYTVAESCLIPQQSRPVPFLQNRHHSRTAELMSAPGFELLQRLWFSLSGEQRTPCARREGFSPQATANMQSWQVYFRVILPFVSLPTTRPPPTTF